MKLTSLGGLGLFAGGLALGIFIGVVWSFDRTGTILISFLLLLSGIVIGAAVLLFQRRPPNAFRQSIDEQRDVTQASPEVEDAPASLPPSSESRSRIPLPLSLSIGNHLEFERHMDTVSVKLRDIANFERLEFAITLPRVRIGSRREMSSWVTQPEPLAWILFIGAMLIYAITRFVSLDRFPIYFFADEAIQTVLAQELIQRGAKDYLGHVLPMFFNAYGFFNPLFTVYPQVIGLLAFGKSIVVTRAISAFITLIGTGAAAIALATVFKIRYWWVCVLFIAITPAFFLHSRTAFETAEMTAFFACFLLCYLLYRTRSPRYIYPALIFAAMTFYSYGNGQLVIGLMGVFLLLADFRFHLRNWPTVVRGLVLLFLLSLPYIQFETERPGEAAYHMRTLDTYILKPIALDQKVQTFISNYAYGLSPQYWYLPNSRDLVRHLMKNYGHITLWTLPLMLIGVGFALWRIKKPEYRVLLLTTIATPIGGVLTDISITRVLAFVIPVAMLTTLGLDSLLSRFKRPIVHLVASLFVFALLSYASLMMLGDALTNAARWYPDYGLYGLQWGAKQIFEIIPELLNQPNTSRVYMSPTWANGTDVFVRYFTPNDPRVQVLNVTAFIDNKTALDTNAIFIMTPEEQNRAVVSRKFKPFTAERVLNYPDGTVGFYFARLEYVDNIDAIFAEEKVERQRPVTETFTLNGETINVTHSRLDAGQMKDLFDKDTFTLVRGLEANPIFFEFTFPTSRPLTGLGADFGTFDFQLTISLFPESGDAPIVYENTYRGLGPDPHIDVPFVNPPANVRKVRIEIRDLGQGQVAKIHVREFAFK